MKLILVERLEDIGYGIECTDYVGDVVNILINRPRLYRIVYDSKNDVYGISDPYYNSHNITIERMFEQGYVQQYIPNEYLDKIKHHPKVPGGEFMDPIRYRRTLFDDSALHYCVFIPKDVDTNINRFDSWYECPIRIKSGTLYFHDKNELSNSGCFKDLFRKLSQFDYIGGD